MGSRSYIRMGQLEGSIKLVHGLLRALPVSRCGPRQYAISRYAGGVDEGSIEGLAEAEAVAVAVAVAGAVASCSCSCLLFLLERLR